MMDGMGVQDSFHVFASWAVAYSYPSMKEDVMHHEVCYAIQHDAYSNGEFHVKPR
jgi:hypothetical protein